MLHPIALAHVLWHDGGVRDVVTIAAAFLQDTVEDTNTSFEQLEARFGIEITEVVREVTDDKSLPKAERKRLQIEHASHASIRAQHVKLADKICNVRDVSRAAPAKWSLERRSEYLTWSRAVVSGCRGVNDALEHEFDAVCRDGDARLEAATRAETEADA